MNFSFILFHLSLLFTYPLSSFPQGGKAVILLPPWGKACPASAGVGMGVTIDS